MIKILLNRLPSFIGTPIGTTIAVLLLSALAIWGLLWVIITLDPNAWERAGLIDKVREGDKFDLKEESDRYIITVFK